MVTSRDARRSDTAHESRGRASKARCPRGRSTNPRDSFQTRPIAASQGDRAGRPDRSGPWQMGGWAAANYGRGGVVGSVTYAEPTLDDACWVGMAVSREHHQRPTGGLLDVRH